VNLRIQGENRNDRQGEYGQDLRSPAGLPGLPARELIAEVTAVRHPVNVSTMPVSTI
jgi:hypothetical protein